MGWRASAGWRCGARLGVEGLLAHANLTSAIPRLSISVAALSVSLAMMVAIAVMIGSFRETVVYWVGQTLQADLFIGPGHPADGWLRADGLRGCDRSGSRRIHRCDALDRFRNIDLVYEGNLAVLGAGSYDVVLDARRPAVQESRQRARGAARGDRPGRGDRLGAVRHALSTSATATPSSCRRRRACKPFRIAAIYYDYSSDRGVVVMDRGTFRKYFGELPADRRGGLPEARRRSREGARRDARHAG